MQKFNDVVDFSFGIAPVVPNLLLLTNSSYKKTMFRYRTQLPHRQALRQVQKNRKHMEWANEDKNLTLLLQVHEHGANVIELSLISFVFCNIGTIAQNTRIITNFVYILWNRWHISLSQILQDKIL